MKADTQKYILVINGGSSSLKFSLYHTASFHVELSGAVSHIGSSHSVMKIISGDNSLFESASSDYKTVVDGAKALISWLNGQQHFIIAAIGHRLVQGGSAHRKPEIITAKVLKELQEFIYLAPNHLPDEIKTIQTFTSAFPDVPQVACYDTYFHKDLPSYTKNYALPKTYRDKGLMRYGFHGLSYEFIMEKLKETDPAAVKKKIIIAHLGNGASMAAVVNGISVETTMGLSPTGGLVMGTRSGDLDPGVVLFLLKEGKLSANQLDELLNKESGMKAIAGISDVQDLLAKESGDEKAKEALVVFCYHAKKFIGALSAAMGGLDLLIFTGGIGENSPVLRERICEGLDFMGVKINKRSNRSKQEIISSKTSRVTIKMMKTDEEWMIAKHTQHIINHRH